MRKFAMFALGGLLALGTGSSIYAQGRGRVPNVPSPQSQNSGRFPGLPPNAGVGQPAGVGGREVPDRPSVRPEAVPGGAPELTGRLSATDQLARTPALASRLAGILGVESLTVEPEGFRNLGQFVATVQVSRNVEGTTFEGLKTLMLEGDGMSLGEAIQAESSIPPDEAEELALEAMVAAEVVISETP